ncbi:MAG: hypothetical protein QXM29_01665 [Nitrososphaerales archaeon]
MKQKRGFTATIISYCKLVKRRLEAMSSTEVVNLTINATEVRSINDIATIMTNKIGEFADRYGVKDQLDSKRIEEDLIYFFVKRNTVGLERLEVHVLDDGEVAMGSISGRRKASLIFNIRYSGGRGYL